MYGIGEVCSLLGVKPHILRYWEHEIPLLAPKKNRTGRRIYSQRDVQTLFRLKHLIYERKFTLRGAQDKIWEDINAADPDVLSRIAEVRDRLVRISYLIQSRSRESMKENAIIEEMTESGQGHLFESWSKRSQSQKRHLLDDIREVDRSFFLIIKESLAKENAAMPSIEPIGFVPLSETRANGALRKTGEDCIRAGKCAFVTVAGGQGSRLGFDGPKGMYPISPIRKASLFQLFAEKLLAASRYYGVEMPWYIMTSRLNHEKTRRCFQDNGYFELNRERIRFFPQRLLPSFDTEGKLLLSVDGGLFKNPDGHGGLVGALKRHGMIRDMQERGIEELFYFQIDNPLVNVPDPVFLGKHLAEDSQVSSKVIAKAYPEEKLGVIGTISGKPGVIEYSDLSRRDMYARDAAGELLYSQGSIAIHLFNAAFLADDGLRMPFHSAKKMVKVLDPGNPASGTVEREAVKLESFIFDLIPQASKAIFYETEREEEFAPLKNKTGVDSVQTAIDGQVEKAARHLAGCGVAVPRNEAGRPMHVLEISPLFALDMERLRERLQGKEVTIDDARLFL